MHSEAYGDSWVDSVYAKEEDAKSALQVVLDDEDDVDYYIEEEEVK